MAPEEKNFMAISFTTITEILNKLAEKIIKLKTDIFSLKEIEMGLKQEVVFLSQQVADFAAAEKQDKLLIEQLILKADQANSELQSLRDDFEKYKNLDESEDSSLLEQMNSVLNSLDKK